MKKYLNNRLYNTDTATPLATHNNGTAPNDLQYLEETLYRKKTGEFFLHAEGGANTWCATRIPYTNNWRGGTQIRPLTYDDAREWAEGNLSAEEYETIFGAVEEDETKTTCTFRLTTSTLETLKRMAGRESKSMSEIVEELITNRV